VSSREAVLGRIRSALAADTVPPPPVPRDYIRVGANPPGSEPVLELMVEGYDNAEIARRLVISQNTVKNHVAAILSKLGVQNRIHAELLRLA